MTTGRRITVMLGGPSKEREISLRSGMAVARALRSLGHEVNELDPLDDEWTLPPGTEAVFLALHGTYGEDGTVQRRLETLGVAYTGFDPEASRVAFDKIETKRRCLAVGVAIPRFCVMHSPAAGWPPGWFPPVVMKPVRQGSSVGLHFVERVEDWRDALSDALSHGSEVLVEEKVPGREVTVGILGTRALPIVEVVPRGGLFDYANKYTPGRTDYFCPARFDKGLADRVQEAALKAFAAVKGRDYARVDLIVRPEGTPVLLEINSLPGMTEASLLPKAAAVAGIPFEALCQQMLDLALARSTQHAR